jgi:hypothetical protein
MKPVILIIAAEWFFCAAFNGSPGLMLQSPGFSGGKLVINSEPTGAVIAINGRNMGQTDNTFVVSQGRYVVEVTGGPGNLQNCSGSHAKAVPVNAGNSVTVTCTNSGWQ